jgi:hypothetical protein
MFVGWDWASTTHDVTVLDEAGAVVNRWASRHTEQDLAAALDRLARHEDPAGLPVIIERSSGLAEYPTPQPAAHLGEARMASFCRRHSYRGGKPPAALLARLRSAPTAPVGIPTATLVLLIESQVQLLHTLLATMPSSRRRSPSASPATHGPSCWPRCLGSAPSTSPSCWPRSGRSWTASTAPSTPPPSAAPRRSPRPPARPAGSTSAGPPTVEPARP